MKSVLNYHSTDLKSEILGKFDGIYKLLELKTIILKKYKLSNFFKNSFKII